MQDAINLDDTITIIAMRRLGFERRHLLHQQNSTFHTTQGQRTQQIKSDLQTDGNIQRLMQMIKNIKMFGCFDVEQQGLPRPDCRIISNAGKVYCKNTTIRPENRMQKALAISQQIADANQQKNQRRYDRADQKLEQLSIKQTQIVADKRAYSQQVMDRAEFTVYNQAFECQEKKKQMDSVQRSQAQSALQFKLKSAESAAQRAQNVSLAVTCTQDSLNRTQDQIAQNLAQRVDIQSQRVQSANFNKSQHWERVKQFEQEVFNRQNFVKNNYLTLKEQENQALQHKLESQRLKLEQTLNESSMNRRENLEAIQQRKFDKQYNTFEQKEMKLQTEHELKKMDVEMTYVKNNISLIKSNQIKEEQQEIWRAKNQAWKNKSQTLKERTQNKAQYLLELQSAWKQGAFLIKDKM